MIARYWIVTLALALTVGCGQPKPVESTCASIEGVSHQGEQYRLDGVCVSTENAQVNAVLSEDWQLSIWTDDHYVPIIAVIEELRWVSPARVQLDFVTLANDVSLDITAGDRSSS
jgi:hypothetical protein